MPHGYRRSVEGNPRPGMGHPKSKGSKKKTAIRRWVTLVYSWTNQALSSIPRFPYHHHHHHHTCSSWIYHYCFQTSGFSLFFFFLFLFSLPHHHRTSFGWEDVYGKWNQVFYWYVSCYRVFFKSVRWEGLTWSCHGVVFIGTSHPELAEIIARR